MTDEELAAIRARWARASNGPWEYVTNGKDRHAIDDDHGVIADLGGRVRADTGRVRDALAIAAAPTDVAALLVEVDRLRAALTERDTLLRELRRVLAAAIFGLPPEEAGRLRGVIWEVLHGDDTG